LDRTLTFLENYEIQENLSERQICASKRDKRAQQCTQTRKMPITWHNAADLRALANLGSGVQLKGFGSRIQFQLPETQQAAEKAQAWLRHHPREWLQWDGDCYAEDSFTALIPQFKKEHEGCICIAFVLQRNAAEFSESWANAEFVIQAILCNEDYDYAELGTFAQHTMSSLSVTREVFCFGGGGTIEQEFHMRPDKTKIFHGVCLRRQGKQEGEWEDTEWYKGCDESKINMV